ncbi:hypothetical protein BH20ACI4_BH20ACI4_27740 [soil metagenome]
MKISVLLFIILLISFFSYQVSAQSKEIEKIKITSSWTGLAPTLNSNLVIKQKKGKFYANGKKIETRLIDELLKQINIKEEQTLETLGITQEWLDENAEKVIPVRLYKPLPEEKDFFINSFRNLKLVEKILPRIFGSWTDDKGIYHLKYSTDNYPEFEIIILKKDGSETRKASSSQIMFMFGNPKLGRAIAALLPKQFANRELLNGDCLAQEIAKEIFDEIEEEIKLVKTQTLIGDKLSLLKDRYKIRKTEISYQTSIDVGRLPTAKEWWKSPDFLSWNAELQRVDLPQNILIGVSLPYKQDKLEGFWLFYSEIDGIIQQVRSVPWLSKYIEENPETEFEIRYVENRSFSPKGKAEFLEDLKKFGANALSSDILNNLDRSSFLQVSKNKHLGWSYWLILPDKRMILWQINGDAGLLWKHSDFKTLNKYETKDWFQTKAIISPNGEIESR